MQSKLLILLLGLFTVMNSCKESTAAKDSIEPAVTYSDYHVGIIKAEEQIAQEDYKAALKVYEEIFNRYEFIFLRDYQIAAQLHLISGNPKAGMELILKGISSGWKLEAIKNHDFLAKYLNEAQWKQINTNYETYRQLYLARLDTELRDQVQVMFEKDQNIAYQASLIKDEAAQEEFILNKFPEHSKNQLLELIDILQENGYPGEFLIGNNFWGSTFLSHHNSITTEFVQQDTLYPFIRPKLHEALARGHISPYEIALSEDWRATVLSEWSDSPFGYLNPPNASTLSEVNENRKALGLRSVELRNQLIGIQEKTGMHLNLPDWVEGRIAIE